MPSHPSLIFIAPSKPSQTTLLLVEEAKKKFDVSLVSLDDTIIKSSWKSGVRIYNKNVDISFADYVFPKIDGKRKDIGLKIVKAYELLNANLPYTSDSLIIAHDKFLTAMILSAKGINVPRSYLVKREEDLKKVIDELNLPVMVKILSGSGGKGVMYVDALDTIANLVNVMESEVLIQEYIPSPPEDIRVIVAGDRIIGAYKRVAKEGEKRANIKLGGKPVSVSLTQEMEEISFKAAEAIKADICAVDIVESTEGKPYVIELNLNPGIKGMIEATGKNIAKEIIDYIYEKVRR